MRDRMCMPPEWGMNRVGEQFCPRRKEIGVLSPNILRRGVLPALIPYPELREGKQNSFTAGGNEVRLA